MNTFNWTISALDCKVDEDNLKDVVYTVHWRYRATDENGITEDFTPYDELTKEQVVGWLEASMDVPAMDLSLDEQIYLLINPIDVTLPPPFEN